MDAEFFQKYVGLFIYIDYYSDEKKCFFLGKLKDVIDDRLHIVSVKDKKEAFIRISEIINFKVAEVKNED